MWGRGHLPLFPLGSAAPGHTSHQYTLTHVIYVSMQHIITCLSTTQSAWMCVPFQSRMRTHEASPSLTHLNNWCVDLKLWLCSVYYITSPTNVVCPVCTCLLHTESANMIGGWSFDNGDSIAESIRISVSNHIPCPLQLVVVSSMTMRETHPASFRWTTVSLTIQPG